ncbi:NAD(P)-binding domain-containing protein [Dietzia sp. PP-33]|nr:NAD(P)-binding domain-containing protein [Dietzia sp. PP-33]
MADRLEECGWPVIGVEPDEGRRRAWEDARSDHVAYSDLHTVDWDGISHLLVAVRTEEQVRTVLATCGSEAPSSVRVLLVSTVRPSFWHSSVPELLNLDRIVECPVSGGEGPARQGTVAMYAAGGREDDSALLAALSASVVAFPRHGDPALIKLVNNTLAALNAANTARYAQLASERGIAPEDFLRALNLGSGRSQVSAMLHQLSRNQLDLLEKDVGLLRADVGELPESADPTRLADLVASALGEIADPDAVV